MFPVVPLLQIQRDLYDLPRGRARFGRYLAALTGGTDDMALPLPAFNPMGGPHIADALDALLGLGAEAVAAEALAEARRRLGDPGADLRVGLVLGDDVRGQWTNRGLDEVNRLRTAPWPILNRGWLAVVLWASEPATPEGVREEVLATVYRTLTLMRLGDRSTLRALMELEGRARGFAGATAPHLDEEDLDYTRAVIQPLRDTDDVPTQCACLLGDVAARRVGYPPMGLSPRAGFALALAEARLAGRSPDAALRAPAWSSP